VGVLNVPSGLSGMYNITMQAVDVLSCSVNTTITVNFIGASANKGGLIAAAIVGITLSGILLIYTGAAVVVAILLCKQYA